MTRLWMSRPKLSLPIKKRCFSVSPSSVVISPIAPGLRSRLAGSKREGSTVPSQGASSATSTSSSKALPPRRTPQLRRTRCHALGVWWMVAASVDSASKLGVLGVVIVARPQYRMRGSKNT